VTAFCLTRSWWKHLNSPRSGRRAALFRAEDFAAGCCPLAARQNAPFRCPEEIAIHNRFDMPLPAPGNNRGGVCAVLFAAESSVPAGTFRIQREASMRIANLSPGFTRLMVLGSPALRPPRNAESRTPIAWCAVYGASAAGFGVESLR